MSFDIAITPILVMLVFGIFLLPIILLLLDFNDEQTMKKDKTYGVEDELIKKIADYKQLPYEHVIFQRKAIGEYINNKGSCISLFILYLKTIHPFIGLFSRFDGEFKRSSRFMTVGFQLTALAYIVTIIFGFYYRKADQNNPIRNEEYDSEDVKNAMIAGFLLSLLTLPLPNIAVGCCKSKIVKTEIEIFDDPYLQSEDKKKVDETPKTKEDHIVLR